MNIARRAFLKNAIELGSVLLLPGKMLLTAADKKIRWSPAYALHVL